jgi:hypothetical protein
MTMMAILLLVKGSDLLEQIERFQETFYLAWTRNALESQALSMALTG